MTIRGITAISALTLLICLSGCSPAKTILPPIKMSVAQVIADYEENESAADNLYEGRELIISGNVSHFSQIRDTIGVNLETENPKSQWSVMCVINKSDESDAYSQLKTVRAAIFTGTVKRVADKKFIHLINCRLTE